ncbi:MAG: polyprenyl synthetase family protein [Chloroflexi bacterium]|nr:polyprenyl synthetase family protein [Chloroflexota bacterium]MBT5627410.1 polyprenyl synthetase family protein [Chloroflexota bacterium]
MTSTPSNSAESSTDAKPAPLLPAFFTRYQSRIDQALRAELTGLTPDIYDIHRYYMGWQEIDGSDSNSTGGKRMRPTLALLAADAVGGDLERATPIAVALEYVHNFSLIHDDLEDMDRVRHHRPTVWAVWGEPAAIVSGNAMLKIADMAAWKLRSAGVEEAVALEAESELTNHYLKMMEGQYLDISFEKEGSVSVEQYLDMIERKTGALIEASIYLGSLVAPRSGPDREKAAALKAIGYDLGRIFQIRDDVLGVWGGEETGKPVGADIKRKKKALPAVHALSNSTGATSDRLKQIFRTEGDLEAEDVHVVLEEMENLGTQDYCQSMAEDRWLDCKRMIESLELAGSTSEEFTELGEFLLVRES